MSRRHRRPWTVLALVAALSPGAAGAPGTANAAQELDGSPVALRGTVVLARYDEGMGRTVLARVVGGRGRRIRAVRPLINYNLDLGVDRHGRVVVVYHRCNFDGACRGPYIVDLRADSERRLELPQRRGCTTNKGSASVWKGRLAFTRSCAGSSASGVMFVDRRGRVRRLLPLTAHEAKFAYLDLVPGLVAVDSLFEDGTRLLSTRPDGCRAATPAPTRGLIPGPSFLTPRRILWWVEEDVFPYGGAETILRHARVGRDCSVTPLGSPVSLNQYNDDTFFPGISVDRGRLYFGNMVLPLSALR